MKLTIVITERVPMTVTEFRTYAVAPHIALMVRYAALTHPTNSYGKVAI